MRGSIAKRGRYYSIILDIGNDEHGKRQQRRFKAGSTKREAEVMLTELLGQNQSDTLPNNSKQTVSDYLTSWLWDVAPEGRMPRTVESYEAIVRNHVLPVVGNISLQKLQAVDVDRVFSRMRVSGLSTNTRHHTYVVLSKALKDAVRKRLIHQNPCQGVEPPKVGRYEVNLPDHVHETISKILDQADSTPYGTLFRFIAHTGLRRGEALALRWANIDLEAGTAMIVETVQRQKGKGLVVQPPKSASGRRLIALDSKTVLLLRQLQGHQLLEKASLEGAYQDKGVVFAGPLGNYLDPSVATRNWEKLVRVAGHHGLRLHDLRHAHAAGLIRVNVHPRIIQERLGHSNAAFTMQVYGHGDTEQQAKAADAFAAMFEGRS
jgi:integrase